MKNSVFIRLHYFRTSAVYEVVGELNTIACLSAPPTKYLLAGWKKRNGTWKTKVRTLLLSAFVVFVATVTKIK